MSPVLPVDRLKGVAEAAPASPEDIGAALTGATGKRVTPCGGGCFLDVGRRPEGTDLLLRTRGLNRVVFYEPGELVVKVEAGITLAALGAVLAERGQELPWDYPWPDLQTVGGIIASGVAGPRRLGFGAPRDHVLGMTAVLSGGQIIRPGGRVMKNVAGYDVCRLLVGSRGTLGVIAEATLKVKSRSEDMWAATARFSNPAALKGTIGALLDSPLNLSFLEIEGRWGAYVVAIGVEGMRERVAAERDAALKIMAAGDNLEEHPGDRARSLLAAWAGRPWEEEGTVFRVSVPRRRIWPVVDGVEATVRVSAGSGVIRIAPGRNFAPREAGDYLGRLADLARESMGWAIEERGALSERAAAPGRAARLADLDEKVRRVFDPARRLSGPEA